MDQFIHRIEDRSSLLMMTGQEVEDGRLVDFFEFRHLTFQEFLTASAMAKGWHPGRKEEDTLVSVLEPYFGKSGWNEVVPLAAVLGGKETEGLIRRLTEEVSQFGKIGRESLIIQILLNCLADEAAARPETVRAAFHELVLRGMSLYYLSGVQVLLQGRYSADFREEAINSCLKPPPGFLLSDTLMTLLKIVWLQTIGIESIRSNESTAENFANMLESSIVLCRIEGALGISELCWRAWKKIGEGDLLKLNTCKVSLQRAGSVLSAMVFSDQVEEHCAALLAFEMLIPSRIWLPAKHIIERLFKLWRESSDASIQGLALRVLASYPGNAAQCVGRRTIIDRAASSISYYPWQVMKESRSALFLFLPGILAQ